MRSTIRVFIKTELKKRETNRAKQTKDATTPVASVAPATPVEAPAAAPAAAATVATDGVAMATIAAGEAQQGQDQTQDQNQDQNQDQDQVAGSSSSAYSSKPLDNAQSRAEDSQMQESGYADAGQQQDNVPADGTALTNGDNNTNADTADQTVRNSHFLQSFIDNSSNMCRISPLGMIQDHKKKKTVHCTFIERTYFLLTCRNRGTRRLRMPWHKETTPQQNPHKQTVQSP